MTRDEAIETAAAELMTYSAAGREEDWAGWDRRFEALRTALALPRPESAECPCPGRELEASERAALRERAERAEAEAAKWRETANTIQRNLAETHEREKRKRWADGFNEGFAAVDEALEPSRALAEASRGLLDALTRCHEHPKYVAVWTLAQAHGGQYDGPRYVAELDAARAALSEWDARRTTGEVR